MSAVILASNDKQKYSTLCGVVISHILLLWSLSYLKTDVRIESHSPENAIQIRFISLNKTGVVQQSSTKLQTASEQAATQSKAQPQSTVATAVQHQQQVKVIHSTESKKLKMDQTTQQTTKTQEKKPTDQQTESKSESNRQSTQTFTETKSSANTEQTASGQSNEIAKRAGGEAGKDNKKEQNAASTSQPQQPLPVSRVDVLSFGKLNYDDRELQNQQRLLVLTIKINPQGQPIDVRVKQSSGISSLDERAIQAAQKAKFKPHIVNGEALAIVVDFPIQLKLGRNR